MLRALVSLAATLALATTSPGQVEIPDLPFAQIGTRTLHLDLYLPAYEGHARPCVLWLHGGGWVGGDRKQARHDARRLLSQGFVVVAPEYRLTTTTLWPAQIHDAKGAVRWARANARDLNIDPQRIIAFGPSAGGQLSAILAVSGGSAELEGEVGGNLDESSRVLGAVSFMAPHDILALDGFHEDPNSFESLLIGVPLGDLKRSLGLSIAAPFEWRARTASTVHWIDRSDAPLMFAHGLADPIYPWTQSDVAHRGAAQHGVRAEVLFDETAGHALPPASWIERIRWMRTVFDDADSLPFGKGKAPEDGDEPSIGVVHNGPTPTLTLDHAPPHSTAVLVAGPRLPRGARTQMLISPVAASAPVAVIDGTATATMPIAGPTAAQWVILYQAPDGSLRHATSNAIAVR